MEARALRLPMLSIALSLKRQFLCAGGHLLRHDVRGTVQCIHRPYR